ncbi:ankyrin repeat domain-containing protein [Rickettsia monacensis]|nr:ankyrin repeat domain-containing protein [Rickettsia monacensis]
MNNNGETVLTLAASQGLEKVCETLIPRMSDEAINHVNNDGETALSIATKNGLRIIARSTCDLLLKMLEIQQLY